MLLVDGFHRVAGANLKGVCLHNLFNYFAYRDVRTPSPQVIKFIDMQNRETSIAESRKSTLHKCTRWSE